ncbi:trehalose operon repressor TreR [Dongshaea marina]|uniref:trehalose operon repressor TreR n=1 Tax=Dongshaea marina TaxID=2047966 RepID=UPI000D3EA87E|nr:trehalose operon repressor TreR [Dongshaea marina]
MQKNLTILDIAQMAGVGKSTVSRVLNQDPKVRAATRDKILSLIEEVGFVPSRSAKAMRSKHSMVLGVVLTRLDSPSENQLIRGILSELTPHHYDTILMESQMEIDKVEHCLTTLKQRGVDGVLLLGFTGLDAQILKSWEERLVLLAWPVDGFSSVCYDDESAIQMACSHLYEKGKRQIGFIGVSSQDETTGRRRTRAYLDFCKDYALEPNYATGELSFQSAYDLAADVITEQTQALVCASDTLALGASRYVQSIGRDDIQISGVGYSELLQFLFPDTISIDLGYERAGHLAAKQLLAQIQQKAPISQQLCECSLHTPETVN